MALSSRRPSFTPGIGRLVRLLAAIFIFNLGTAAWSAVVAGRLAQLGEGSAMLGTLYAVCELSRLPGALLLPAATLRFGPRRVTQAGLLVLTLLPAVALTGLDGSKAAMTLVASALPSMAVYVGLPAFILAAAGAQQRGWALAWLGLAGGAGGALGPWIGGSMAQAYGLLPVLLLFGLGAVLLLPEATTGPLPTSSPWPGWGSLLRRGLPWQALAALALASAADAGRAALVPAQLVSHGLDLADIGLLLGAGSSIAGIGFLAFGRLADRAPSARVLGVGLLVLTMGSFGSAMTTAWSPAFALAAAILGIGASGMRLGAEVQLIDWVGPDRAAVAAALGETTVLGGRAVGAPVVGALGTAQGDVYAFGTIGLIGLVAMAPLMLFATRGLATVLASARLRPQVVAHAGSMYPTPCSPACD